MNERQGRTMTPEQTEIIRRSFDSIWPVRRKFAGLFYRRFFELAPDAQRLFPSDMERQYLRLMAAASAPDAASTAGSSEQK